MRDGPQEDLTFSVPHGSFMVLFHWHCHFTDLPSHSQDAMPSRKGSSLKRGLFLLTAFPVIKRPISCP